MTMESFESAVEITRGGSVESAHAAAIAIADPEGRLLASLGDPDLAVYLRSAAKPFQAASVVAAGAADRFGFSDREIALLAASHGGETSHVAAAASMLLKAALDPSALGCGTHPPFHKPTAEGLLRRGEKPAALMNNCSGKHAGMLAAARASGDPIDSYLDPAHPVQRANLAAVAAFTRRPAGQIAMAIDGCSAPTFSVSLREAAAAFARLAAAPADVSRDPLVRAAARVADAMRAHPEMVAGEGMLDTALMRAVPGLIAKIGADGVHAMGWPGRGGPLGIVLKIMDGDVGRARTAVVLGILRQVGLIAGSDGLPETIIGPLIVRSLRGTAVGEVRPVFALRRPA